VLHEGRLRFTPDCAEAVRGADIVFICVGTPPTETGEADLSAIDNVARLIAKESRSPKLVIEKSTVPAQTGEQLKRALQVYARDAGARFRVASNPEFLREGTAVEDSFIPTGSSSAWRKKKASCNSASCIARFLKAASAVPCISQIARRRPRRISS